MNRAKHLALAAAAGDVQAAPLTVGVMPGSEDDDPSRHPHQRAVDSRVAVLEEELLKLRKRCRARELALAGMAGAVDTLRRANRALNDENGLLRQQVAELKERVPAERWPEVRVCRRPAASDG